MTDAQPLSWADIRLWEIGLLERSTGNGLEHWLARIRDLDPPGEHVLRDWLTREGVSGYPRALLVHETFGYPDSAVRVADEMLDAQYDDRPALRPILDAVLLYAGDLDDVGIQTRQTHVALTGPHGTFAIVQPTTKHRVDLGLRIELPPTAPSTRLRRSAELGPAFPSFIPLTAPGQVDADVAAWLKHAYDTTT
ncbi:DUF5655 domain-containing protein [Cryobacterium sp. SO2]|uniref:DUF5655 domain-containing protein n=1 Tax=Cryobacterium sp. SO2 TaxID=1897060 RepID=UPI00223D0624|nr:DUF5655 domain-containing protein [Cryobacterium sp. SO2]WEO77576.1 DUF5655 domain-containing protein [Cryobacterium sp. SO2]